MIKYPGGEVAIWTVIWILAGSVVSYTSFQDGKISLSIIFAIPAVAAALLWFDIRAAKWVIMGYYGFVLLGVIVRLFEGGFELRTAVRTLLPVYTIFLLARWDGGPHAKEESMEERFL